MENHQGQLYNDGVVDYTELLYIVTNGGDTILLLEMNLHSSQFLVLVFKY